MNEEMISTGDLRERFDFVAKRRLTGDILGMIGDIILYLEEQKKEQQEKMKNNPVTRMKVRVGYIVEGRNDNGKQSETVWANAVYDPNPESENHKFAKATPSVNVSAVIDNPNAFGKLELDKEYYLDWIPVEKSES